MFLSKWTKHSFLSLCSRIGSSKQGSKAPNRFYTVYRERKRGGKGDKTVGKLLNLTELVDWRRAPHHTIDRSEANISGTLFIMSAYPNLLTLHSLGHR